MPIFIMPTIYTHQPIISTMMIDKNYIRSVKQKILDRLLLSKEGSILVQIGSADIKKEISSTFTQEALTKLRGELGSLSISTAIITGELDLTALRYPVYLLATRGGGGADETKIPVNLP